MLTAVIFFFIMSLLVKSLKPIPTSQIVFFRAWVALLISWVTLKKLKINPMGTHKKILFLRGLFGTIALIGFFSTLAKLPLATASILQNLSPIFTSIFAVIFLNEVVFKKQWIYFTLAFAGVVLIQGFQLNEESFWILAGVLSSVSSAAAYTCIGKIKTKEHPLVIIFYFPLVTIPIILPFVLFQWVTPDLWQWFLLVLVGIVVQIAQYFMTLSYQTGDNSKVSIISYLGVVLSILAGFFVFDEKLDLESFLGILLILAGVAFNSLNLSELAIISKIKMKFGKVPYK